MKYSYEDLSSDQFEKLVVFLCQELLGIATQGFAKGRDGGRDAKFVGTAKLYPSEASPWSGTTIIQAKHTNGYNKLFSESDFYRPSSSSNVLAKEIPRIKKLRKSKELDHYILFSNRRLTGIAESDICSYIAKQCDIPASSIRLCGVELLETWLKTFPKVAGRADLDMVDSPLLVSPDELSELIHALARHKKVIVSDGLPTHRTSYADKNKINNMPAEYAAHIQKKYLKDTVQIQSFLSMPENYELMKLYENIVDEFQLKIIAKRKDYQNFGEVMNYLSDLLSSRDPVLKKKKRLTRAMLFYMYWHCDIGRDEYASPN